MSYCVKVMVLRVPDCGCASCALLLIEIINKINIVASSLLFILLYK